MQLLKVMNSKLAILIISIILSQSSVNASELVLGKENIGNNISVIFEGAPKDNIYSSPNNTQLPQFKTDVHIEALINWNENINIPGQVPGSFIPYLIVSANIQNQKTKAQKTVSLVPHINLIDGFHYAKNIKLPGSTKDLYRITFTIENNPEQLSYHQDWKDAYSIPIFTKASFTYQDLDFLDMSKVTRP